MGDNMNIIYKCSKCLIHKYQTPSLESIKSSDVMWVGLSAKQSKGKENFTPLAPNTLSGKLIKSIEENLYNITTYKTNLVKCVPLDELGKLRYPTKNEILNCLEHFKYELNLVKPKIVFLLGNKVSTNILTYLKVKIPKYTDFEFEYGYYNDIILVPIQHPSYIAVYKKKSICRYKNAIKDLVHNLVK